MLYENGDTLLGRAAREGNIQEVNRLIKQKENIDIGKIVNNEIICSPLYLAVQEGYPEIVQKLIKEGAKIEAANKNGAIPLYIAAENGHIKVVELLLEAGATIEAATNHGFTSLLIASQNGHLEIIKLLLEAGAKIEVSTKDGATPLFIAAQTGHLEVVKLLLEPGAKIEASMKDRATPLFIAAQNGYIEVVELLLEVGAKIEASIEDGTTPLYIAAQNGHLEVVKLLLEERANIEAAQKNGATPLYIAAQNGHLEVVKLLLEVNANVEAAYRNGATSLFIAARNGHLEVVKVLLAAGANIDKIDANNEGIKNLLKIAASIKKIINLESLPVSNIFSEEYIMHGELKSLAQKEVQGKLLFGEAEELEKTKARMNELQTYHNFAVELFTNALVREGIPNEAHIFYTRKLQEKYSNLISSELLEKFSQVIIKGYKDFSFDLADLEGQLLLEEGINAPSYKLIRGGIKDPNLLETAEGKFMQNHSLYKFPGILIEELMNRSHFKKVNTEKFNELLYRVLKFAEAEDALTRLNEDILPRELKVIISKLWKSYNDLSNNLEIQELIQEENEALQLSIELQQQKISDTEFPERLGALFEEDQII